MPQPQRIISLVPSQTELLYYLGLEERVVGITKFCIHPEKWFRAKQRVGGTKSLNIEKIRALNPDLIIANKEENLKAEVEMLQALCPAYVSDINNLEEALTMIKTVGQLTDTSIKAASIIQKINEGFSSLKIQQQQRVAYLIWKDPYMTVGNSTFIHNMIESIGWKNVFENKERYPETSVAQLQALQPDMLLLSSEPYPFNQSHAQELQKLLPHTKMLLVDGEMFSWYGSRMIEATSYFQQLINENKL